jgi:branched-chain amino acid transport system permease protein
VLLVLLLQYARDGIWPFVRKLMPAGPPVLAPDTAPPLPVRQKPETGELILDARCASSSAGWWR